MHTANCCFGKSELYGKTLDISIFGTPPYIVYDPVAVTLTGIDIDLLRFLATTIQFWVNVVPTTTWGVLIDGEWTGIVREHVSLALLLFMVSLFFRS